MKLRKIIDLFAILDESYLFIQRLQKFKVLEKNAVLQEGKMQRLGITKSSVI